MRYQTILGCGAAAVVFASGSVFAQQTLDHPVGREQLYSLDSGVFANPTDRAITVFTDFVSIEDAAWLRLYFREVTLDTGSFIRITSALDSEFQDLDARGVARWSETSAYFNGDTVFIDLVAGPHTDGNRVILDRVALELPHSDPTEWCGICGTDERYRSYENFAGRQMPVGCTATIWTENACMVSAGHCAGGGQVIEFNVPDSNSDCTLNHPPVEDQFPIVSYQYLNAGVGADWAVMTTGVNNLGENAYEHQGVLRRIHEPVLRSGDPIDVWGFAVDYDCTLNQTQQHSPNGNIVGTYSTYYTLDADITFGNSGSSLLYQDEIVGIITHCSDGCPNYATRIDLSSFVNARDAVCPQFLMSDPSPGLAGQDNTVHISGMASREKAWVVYGLQAGSTGVPGCPGTSVDINRPTVAGYVITDNNGEGSFTAFVPGGASGATVYMQAVDVTNCVVSNLVSYQFP